MRLIFFAFFEKIVVPILTSGGLAAVSSSFFAAQTKKQKPDIVLHDSGVLVAQTIYGFDSSVMKKIEKFLREQKPELLHHQKFLENGTAERAKESGTEQNYNMIDGCVNNNPKKPRIIGNRISVLDRLHIKLEERKQKSQPQQQQQQERSRKN